MILPAIRSRKLAAAVFATKHKLPIPHGVHPNAPGEGAPTLELYNTIRRYAHLTPHKGWNEQLEWLLYPSEHASVQRAAIVGNAEWMIQNRDRIGYSQGGARLAELNYPRHLPLITDCSAAVKLQYAWMPAGVPRPPDPTGDGWGYGGYTGSMLTTGQHITLAAARAGDYAVISKWGDDDGSHAVTLLEDGRLQTPASLAVCSHGGSGAWAARRTNLQDELDAHERNGRPAHVAYLRVIH